MISIPIRYRRAERGQFFSKLQHAVPSIVVLSDGIEHLSHDPQGAERALGAIEVAAAVLVMGSVVRGFRKLIKGTAAGEAQHTHHGVDWIDIFIGVMLAVEAYAKYHATHHIPRPTVVLALAMLILGVMHGRIAAWGDRRRQLRVSPEGISVQTRPISRMTLAWNEVASIDIDERYATIKANDGRKHRLDLSDVRQPAAVRDALMQARMFLDAAREAARIDVTDPASN